ncbi:Alpha/Beta hydrolase protein [Butyriboletus roseoflavus]|nr:Alpha/Beta hydrolase protein [Butyriboletus roseoflavus]
MAGPVQVRAAPTVTLDSASVTGITSGSTNQFLGIPFAQPLTGSLCFQLPQTLPLYNTSFSAMAYGPTCPQQAFALPLPSGLPAETVDGVTNLTYSLVIPSAEDCLTLNVVTSTGTTPTSNLPMVVVVTHVHHLYIIPVAKKRSVQQWIFGGGFEFGGTDICDGSVIVEKAISLGVPVI